MGDARAAIGIELADKLPACRLFGARLFVLHRHRGFVGTNGRFEK